MGYKFFQSVIRSAIAVLLVAFLASFADAQMFGIPPARSGKAAWKEVSGLVSEEQPIASFLWSESGELDPEGNDSEKWFSDAGLQKSLGKLKQAIVTLAQEQAPPLLARFVKDVGWKLVSKAGVVEIESVDVENQTGKATLIVRLGDDEKIIAEFLSDLMDEAEVDSVIVGEEEVWQIPDAPLPVTVGIHSGHFVVAAGQGQWEALTQRIDKNSGAPQWLKTRMEVIPIARRGQFGFGSFETILKLLPPEAVENPEFQRIRDVLKLDGMKSVSFSSGTDSVSNVSMIYFEADKEGLASVMDVPAIDRAKLKELPADSISAVAFRFSPSTVMELVRSAIPPELYERGMEEFADETELDFEADIMDHLEGTIRNYQSGIVINPKQMVMIGIKDELKFEESLERINETMRRFAADSNLEFYDQEKSGIQTWGIKNFGVSAYWAVHRGELYISTNSRAIGSHIRKAGRGGKTSILDTELGKQVLSESKSMGLEGPIMVQHYDFDQITETVVPMVQGLFAFLPPDATEAFDFGPNDFPPIESLLGLRNTNGMIFKSSSGYVGISRYDTPAALELSTVAFVGVGVGMLLPAVQQTREAARRTTSMNNQRQLVLALHNYHSAHGSLPPAYTVDEDGNPLLSWRVQILPFMEQQDLYDQFHHDEPWDSEHNIQLLDKMPEYLKNPSIDGQPGWTDYVAPMSDDSVLVPEAGTDFDAITDGTSNTIVLMEVGASQQVPWTAPQDFEIEKLESLDLDNGHPGTVTCAMADGSVQAFSKNSSVESFIKACKKSDGSGIDDLE